MIELTYRKAGLIAGFSLVVMAILAGFAYGFAMQGMIVPDDVDTVANIQSSMLLFRASIASFLVIIILDVVIAWALYFFLKEVDKSLSLLTAWFRIFFAAIFGAALLNLIQVSLLLNGSDHLVAFEQTQLVAMVRLSLNAFNLSWAFALVIFGCHLLSLGYLVFRSKQIPTIWGVMLVIAGMCYLLTNFANLLLLNYEAYRSLVETYTVLPMVVGELGFGLWLLFKGGLPDTEARRARNLA